MEAGVLSDPGQTGPRHVAIVMDGNGRWAKQRKRPRVFGHRKGAKSVRAAIRGAMLAGVEVLTLFAFSSENWKRPLREVNYLMGLFFNVLESELAELCERDIRLRIIGDTSVFDVPLQQRIEKAIASTAHCQTLELVIAANYGGQWDIAQAAQKLARSVQAGDIQPEQITPEALSKHIQMADLPLPDLLIRTGGEQRISNFLLWQLAYSEFYFTPVLWPDFDEQSFADAVAEYQSRQRRFGMTSAQVEKNNA
ncbi:polyprenyl diphosphate synthase [Pelagibaculum spongiae]|uniref:Ditrans,polycis-undecaprenyl-diphosphate synthase ((2E,6E)-farnesyl-diphosphate specific) n=1 Tax=Pelagibaculum spongiae TaxID=2080658 RepID=A0A2V1GWI1_9GAMM|nr:polyprenyl diphosphate synthase [Pelagibaculum spongiae]PVZ64910.1 di-trans,poly-cis-decaprenylcistransferase [Pelagibaculum spongiae]